jgi:hypothetical protein
MDSDDIHLILHNVAGSPSFDIAVPMEVPGRPDLVMWIIPTSGHRAHPAVAWKLKDIFHENIDLMLSRPLTGLPDHYPAPTVAAITTAPAAFKSVKPHSLEDFLK